MKLITIIIPVQNEQSTIGYILDEVHNSIIKLKDYEFEIIVVIDHCSDDTEIIAREKSAIVCYNEERIGKGNAIITGLSKAKGDIVIMLDGDGSHNPSDIPKFIDAVEKGASLVIGSRAKGGSDEYEIVRLFGNASFTFLLDFLFGVSLTDSLNGYKAISKEIFRQYKYHSSGFEIEVEFIYSTLINNYCVVEVSSHERSRMGGKMKSRTLIDGFKFLAAIVKWGLRFKLFSSMRYK